MTRIDLHESSKLTFAESAAPSTPSTGLVLLYAKTDSKLYIKDDTGTETDITTAGGPGGGISTGTAFPGSPANNDLFYRTDRDILYFYDSTATQWMSVAIHELGFAMRDAAVNAGDAAGSVNVGRARVPWRGVYSIYILNFEVTFTTSGTNNGSNYSTFKLNYGDSADADTQVGSTISTSALSASTVYNLSDAVNANLSTNARWLKCRKDNGAGSPGNGIFTIAGLTYRLVG